MHVRPLSAAAIAGPLVFAAAVLLQDVIQFDYLVANGDDPWTTQPKTAPNLYVKRRMLRAPRGDTPAETTPGLPPGRA